MRANPKVLWAAALLQLALAQAVFAAEERESAVRTLAFSPDGARLAAATGEPDSAGHLAIWNVADRSVAWTRKFDRGLGAIAYSPDGRWLAVGGFSPEIEILQAQDGQEIRKLVGHTGAVRCLDFARDGSRLASAGYEKTIKLWNPADGALLESLEGHKDRIFGLAFNARGDKLYSGSFDETLRTWDLASNTTVEQSDGRFAVRHVSLSPSGRYLVVCRYDGRVRIYDLEEQRLVARLPIYSLDCAQLSPDNRWFAASGGPHNVVLRELDLRAPTSDEAAEIQRHIARWDEPEFAAREDASAQLVRIGLIAEPALAEAEKSDSAERRIRARRTRETIWQAAPRQLEGHRAEVEYVVFSPDGQTLASGDRQGVVKLWRVETGELVSTLHIP
jgi:WD40 repeat protein